jgi:hypothetical protein
VVNIIISKQKAKFKWLQNPSQTNEDNVNNTRRETSRTFSLRKKSLKETVKSEIYETYIEAQITLRRVTNLELT